ncbi:NAD(P)H-dependent oxidoreductase subunit E [bacterium]|nr:NAD(P)H-dependent oxidoreductase subunit E [bacterium]MBU3930273.1 NAD(P)H-dependent oxidoreductase subunit E [bacterium]
MPAVCKNKKQRSHKLSPVRLDRLIRRYKDKPGSLLGILEEAQKLNKYKYLPEETLVYIAQKISVPLSQVYSVVTFYSFFNLQPQGERTITVCRGTACHTRGSKDILQTIRAELNIDEDSDESVPVTTEDNKFTTRTVACIGQCALAPVAEIDGRILSRITREKIRKILKSEYSSGKK